MGVYFKGMKIPKNCNSCPMQNGQCLIPFNPYAEDRPKDCPSIFIPPHGRLIDADALKTFLVFSEKTAEWAVPALRAVLMVIDEMSTIIEAEE